MMIYFAKSQFDERPSKEYVGATISRPRAADCRPYNVDYKAIR